MALIRGWWHVRNIAEIAFEAMGKSCPRLFLPELIWSALLLRVSSDPRMQALKEVSRSFYLSLRLLPSEMRPAASVGYLLARTSDTIADSASAATGMRLACLERFHEMIQGSAVEPHWPSPLLTGISDPREQRLMDATADWLGWMNSLPAGQVSLVREVVGIIIGGQKLDLCRFDGADAEHPVALAEDSVLEDYTWRVAGCVGAFWTKLGFLTMGGKFSLEDESVLLDRGVRFGKGLQLVNILRDLPFDLSQGRCYLPVSDPRNRVELLESHRTWTATAKAWVGEGFLYADALTSRRLRAASVLPARIARETIERLETADWQTLEQRVKVPRSRVYRALVESFLRRPKF